LSIRQDVGALWENYLIGERIKANYNEGLGKEFYFWRTYDRQEIDLVEESSDTLTALEFKWGNKKPDIPAIFKETYPNAVFDVVSRDDYLNYI
jgi:predicted AAA+ superfamily ATPase